MYICGVCGDGYHIGSSNDNQSIQNIIINKNDVAMK